MKVRLPGLNHLTSCSAVWVSPSAGEEAKTAGSPSSWYLQRKYRSTRATLQLSSCGTQGANLDVAVHPQTRVEIARRRVDDVTQHPYPHSLIHFLGPD